MTPYYDDERWKKALDEAVEKERKKIKKIRILAILVIIFAIVLLIVFFFFRDETFAYSVFGVGTIGTISASAGIIRDSISFFSDTTSLWLNMKEIFNKQGGNNK